MIQNNIAAREALVFQGGDHAVHMARQKIGSIGSRFVVKSGRAVAQACGAKVGHFAIKYVKNLSPGLGLNPGLGTLDRVCR